MAHGVFIVLFSFRVFLFVYDFLIRRLRDWVLSYFFLELVFLELVFLEVVFLEVVFLEVVYYEVVFGDFFLQVD